MKILCSKIRDGASHQLWDTGSGGAPGQVGARGTYVCGQVQCVAA